MIGKSEGAMLLALDPVTLATQRRRAHIDKAKQKDRRDG